MAKETSTGLRLKAETKNAIRRAAKEEVRSVSSLIEKIITDWLIDRGYLPKPSTHAQTEEEQR